MLLMYSMYMFFFSSLVVPKLATFLKSSSLEFALFIRYKVFSSHFRLSEIITPNNFAYFTIFIVQVESGGELMVISEVKNHHFCFLLVQNHFLSLSPFFDII